MLKEDLFERFPCDSVFGMRATGMLSLHLLQNCMVNTLMLQQVLAQPHWTGRLTSTDLRVFTPLILEHVNPYDRFEIDMATRLPVN